MTTTVLITDEVSRQRVIRSLQKAPLRDKSGNPMLVTVKRRKRRRSLQQNALMWAWNTIIADETGHTPEEIHELVKRRLLPPVVVEIDGEPVEMSASTHDKDTAWMMNYLDQYQAWAGTNLNIVLPSPEDPVAWEAYERSQAA